jgi:hypothetical protein
LASIPGPHKHLKVRAQVRVPWGEWVNSTNDFDLKTTGSKQKYTITTSRKPPVPRKSTQVQVITHQHHHIVEQNKNVAEVLYEFNPLVPNSLFSAKIAETIRACLGRSKQNSTFLNFFYYYIIIFSGTY